MADQQKSDSTLARTITSLIVGNDLERARKRMRNSWVAGFIWSALSFAGAASGIWSLAPDTENRIGLWLFILVILEVGLVAYLSYGVLQRRRWAATVLFFYFWISRIPWIMAGLIRLQSGLDIGQFLLLQALPTYLFFQGMRGAWTYFYLTHPQYPNIPEGEERGAPTPHSRSNDTGVDDGSSETYTLADP